MAEPRPQGQPRMLSRLGWFAGLWLASVLGLGVVAMIIRWMIRTTG